MVVRSHQQRGLESHALRTFSRCMPPVAAQCRVDNRSPMFEALPSMAGATCGDDAAEAVLTAMCTIRAKIRRSRRKKKEEEGGAICDIVPPLLLLLTTLPYSVADSPSQLRRSQPTEVSSAAALRGSAMTW